MTKRSIYIVCLSCLWAIYPLAAQQWKWFDPMEAGFPVVQNQGFADELANTYRRLPDRAEKLVPKLTWEMSRQSAGLAVHFYSDSPQIRVRYAVGCAWNFPHMPTTGVSGVDLYRIDSDGKQSFCFGDYSFQDTVNYHYTRIPANKYHRHGYEYRLYLPLYNEVKWLEVGVLDGCEMKFLPASPEQPIVLYGTSIAQGGCASRPAMAWSTILQRSLDRPLVNLGFSGSGKMEPEVVGLVDEVDASLYILDCLPNLYGRPEEELAPLLTESVRRLRRSHPATPILMLEHAGLSNWETDTMQCRYLANVNRISRRAYEQLCAEGVPQVYYLSHEELALSADAWVDVAHPNDFGMTQYAEAVGRKVREMLHLPEGPSSTMRPVTQDRCGDGWMARHLRILEECRENPPKAVLLGNSIVHYWGGAADCPQQNGEESWRRELASRGYRNLGFAWDRIENVLWRVCHGELDGYEAERVVLMIGVNNTELNTDEEISEGIRFLLRAIRRRQPAAQVKAVGVLPCRGEEERIRGLNARICQVAQEEGALFSNPGTALLQGDGRIDESLFTDGVHPNALGYEKIASGVADFPPGR